MTKKVIQALLKSAVVEQWGKVQVIDPDTDDKIWAAALRPTSEDQREASYIRVSDKAMYPELWLYYSPQYFQLVSKKKPFGQTQETMVTFYGLLQHIIGVHFESPQPELGLKEPKTIMLGAIKTCEGSKPDPKLFGLDFHFYQKEREAFSIVDIGCIECLVGRVRDVERKKWAIVDRTGSLVRNVYLED